MEPQIVMPEFKGRHNSNIEGATKRLEKGGGYKDQSTIIISPSRGMMPCKVVQNWMNLMRPMNQKVMGVMFALGMEVGEAYNQTIQSILDHPELSKWKYILTIEDDNMPPADGLLKLYEAIEGKVDGNKYDVVGGLYWTKGEGGQPMIYGDPKVMPKNFMPQVPLENTVQPANGLGMGFNLWRLDMFKDPNLRKPWFVTKQSDGQQYTQDLWFFEDAAKHGYKFACDTRVKVGHYDFNTDIIW